MTPGRFRRRTGPRAGAAAALATSATVAVAASAAAVMTVRAAVAPPPAAVPPAGGGPAGYSRLARPGPDGKLVYPPYDAQGDTLLDFSNCGYGGGGVPLPDVPARVTVDPRAGAGDDLPRVQAAVDRVAALPPGPNGFRGAVLLKRGTYRLGGTLRIAASGVVLRGEGQSPDGSGTVLIATGKEAKPLIRAGGRSGPDPAPGVPPLRITDAYVPVGARRFTVADGSGLRAGQAVLVRRFGDAAWIREMGMDRITPRASDPAGTRQWSPFSLDFDRVVTAVSGNTVTVDAPIACAIDARWGGGEVQPAADPGRIEHVGVEDLYAESEFDRGRTAKERGKTYYSDEAHATHLVQFADVKDAWARDLTAVHFYHGVADLGRGAKWVTVRDCSALDPVSVITGGRRYPFNSSGQLDLVQRCYARGARHAFVVGGSHVCGPNVFLDCRADENYATSEPHQRWSVGGLYDGVTAPMAFQDRQWMGSGHGWAGGNYVVWNGGGSVVCEQPPTAQNFCVGFVGEKAKGAFPRPDGWWESYGRHVAPRSLYRKQLEDRLGAAAALAALGASDAPPAPPR